MITGKELKKMVAAIPDNATVLVNGVAHIVNVEVSDTHYGRQVADIRLSPGFVTVREDLLAAALKARPAASFPDRETRPVGPQDVETR